MSLTQFPQSLVIQPVATYGPAFAAYLGTNQAFFMGFLARPA